MDVPTSLSTQPDSVPRKTHESGRGWVLLLTQALPVVCLAFTSGVSSPTVSSAPAAAIAGPPANEVTISGEVLHPGCYQLLPDERVAGAVLLAGGLTSSAKDTVKVIRNVLGRGNVTLVVNLRNILTGPMPGNDLPFCPMTPLL
jgi:hypothetical protein